MLGKLKIAMVLGEKSDATKMLPMISQLKKNNEKFELFLISTATKSASINKELKPYGVETDIDLNVTKRNQTTEELLTATIVGVSKAFEHLNLDLLLVQEDTISSTASALAAFYKHMKVGCIGSGFNKVAKSMSNLKHKNKILIRNLTDYHFTPTEESKMQLINEGVKEETIYVTGSIIVDVLLESLSKKTKTPLLESIKEKNTVFLATYRLNKCEEIFKSVEKLIQWDEKIEIVYPLNVDPIIRTKAISLFSDHARVHLMDSIEMETFHRYMNESELVLTDSKSVHVEATKLEVPVLWIEEAEDTTRTKLIEGNKEEKGNQIFNELQNYFEDPFEMKKKGLSENFYGNGTTALTITHLLEGLATN